MSAGWNSATIQTIPRSHTPQLSKQLGWILRGVGAHFALAMTMVRVVWLLFFLRKKGVLYYRTTAASHFPFCGSVCAPLASVLSTENLPENPKPTTGLHCVSVRLQNTYKAESVSGVEHGRNTNVKKV